MTDFVHLHVHSDFSLQDAAVSVMALADRAEELGMSHLALTDHGNMFGAMEFLAACGETINAEGKHEKRKKPLKPIVGCEVYVSPGSRFEKKGSENDNKYYHLVLLAANREGYLNLVKLCSFAYTEGFYYRPRIDEELLAQYHGGLIALSACVSGEIPKLIQAGKIEEAERKARYYRDLFGNDNFYLEIQDHGIPGGALKGTSLSQKDITGALAAISLKTGIPLAATNDVHYLNRKDYIAHDILLCIGTGKLRSEEKRKKYYGEQFYLKSGDEMAAVFPEYPEAIANTLRIAERCVTDVPRLEVKDLPRFLPEFTIPPDFADSGEYLRRLARDGLVRRYGKEKAAGASQWEEIQKRAEYELDTIISMGFTGYFLIVADFINWAKEHGIPVGPGRGSGAGSIVAYALRITDIDPLKYKLLFERFLNPERISMPDFDLDFANEGRDDVIKYVTKKYGADRVGQIITFGTLGAKAVIKDVARVLGISIPESDMITKLIPRDPQITLKKAFEDEPKLRELEQNPKYTELFTLARKLEGLNRHSSIHAAGVVIGKSALYNFVPLYRDPRTGDVATQYSMNFLERCGLVKMDFLGLKTLDVIRHTEELIRRKGGEYADFSIETIPETDEATFKMLGEGKSFEVFQFESEGMQNILKQAKPNSIEDLIALNSLYRPGPMENIPQFVDSKNGRQTIRYPDPSLEDILKETYGVIVYQEQVMQVARIIAGFSLGHADELRRAMGKKNMEKMVREKEKFIAGAVQRGYNPQKADDIFELLIPFAGYGFNKSHAAAYSVIAYHTAYLKANFPSEFMAANLTNEIYSANKDRLSECIDEARKMGIAVDPPDLNRSDKFFTIVEGRIVYGLLGIKGLGEGPAEEIVRCRKDGPYRDFVDFLSRVDIRAVGKGVIERLIQTGAFDSLGVSRGTLAGNLERVMEYVQNIKEDKKFGQVSLFGDTGEKEYPDFEFEDFPEISREEKLQIEKKLIGFYFSGHPMDEYREVWERVVKVDLGKPETIKPGSAILVGIIKTIKIINTSRGDKMAYATLADYNGEIELTIFPQAWKQCQDKVEADKVAMLKGKIEYLKKDKDRYNFIVDDWVNMNEAEELLKEEESRSRKWDKYRNILKYAEELELRMLDLGNPAKPEAGTYTVVGLIKSLKPHIDKKGKEMAFGTLQNEQGEIDLVFFSRTWENCKALVETDEIMAFRGTIDPLNSRNPEKPGFMVSSIPDINKLIRAASRAAGAAAGAEKQAAGTAAGDNGGISKEAMDKPELHIRLAEQAAAREENLFPLRNYLFEHPGPCTVFIHVPVSGGERVVRAITGIGAVSESGPALRNCAGVAEVWRE
ncbi:MAG: DNA polymerase III subunit alpha [Treponema sp.]|jgi:DNA polymerase-3 subunit alpha|nr:DNA polymerase III subunit alpha [Treponema sp.]